MKTMTFAVLAAVSVPRIFAITVEVGDGESEAVKIAAENLRIDVARACPNHAKDSRRIVVRTKAGGPWESSTRTYANGVWTVTGADRRGTVYGIYAISDELGVSPFHWMDDIPVAPRARFDLSTKPVKIGSPAVKYRGIFINDEGWCLRSWAVHNYEKDGTKSLGVKSYEKIFELMLRCRLNVIWPAMHPGGYEFVTRPENMELADRMGIVVGTSHCEPMLRNNVYWDKKTQGPWNYATNRAEIDKYWQWAVDRYLKQEILWTIGIRGTHDEPMAGSSIEDKIAVMDEVFKTQLGMLGNGERGTGNGKVAMNFIPYKEVLPLYESGLKVPKGASIMWVDDNFGYIRRLGGPGAADHTGGMYWHVSYFGGPHSFTHVCTTAPGFMWYELGAKCIDNNAKETWILNVGDVKPADILIDAFGKIAWSPRDYGADAQTKILLQWAEKFVPGKDAKSVELKKRIVRHMDNYYRLGTIRKPELMAKQWVEKLTDAEKKSLMSQYIALEKEDVAIEEEFRKLPTPPLHHSSTPPLPDAWFDAFGFQARFMAAAGRYFMSDDWLEESGKARVQSEINALGKRYDEIFDGKWKGFWFDTFPARGWDNTENGWAAQMQWPWKEPAKGRHYEATQGGDGISEDDWIDAAKFVRSGKAKDGAWAKVRGLGVSNRAMALLPVKEGAGKGAWMEYEVEGRGKREEGRGGRELVLQFLPDYRLYPGMKLCVEVSVNGGAPQIVEVPYSDGTRDENSQGRSMAVQDNFCRAFVPCALRDGKNVVRVTAFDAGVVLDRLAVRSAPEKITHPFEKAEIVCTTEKDEYEVGEEIAFSLTLDNAYAYAPGEYSIKWRMFDDDGKKSEGKEPLPLAKPLVLSTTLKKPGFVRVGASVVGKDGREIRSTLKPGGPRIFFEGGVGAEMDKIKSAVSEPKDFDAYWKKQIARLKDVPVEVLDCKELPSKNPKVKLYAIAVRAPGRAVQPPTAKAKDVERVTGYLSVPADGHKVPARVEFKGYGVHYEKMPSWWLNENQVWFLVNAHGCELDREDGYYRQLKESLMTTDSKGRRHEYGLNPDENASPDTSYFNGMVMRVLRALEYVKSRPEWDGKNLTVAGGSQGGFQSIWGAALDKDVTRLECDIPWNCDAEANIEGRIKPTWGAEWSPGLAYFNGCNMARRILPPKVVTIYRAALGDELCPPAGVAAFYNALPCEKSVKWVQGSTHGYVPQYKRHEFERKEKTRR